MVVVTPRTRCQGSLHSMVAGHWALLPALAVSGAPELHPQSSARDCFIILRFIASTLCIIRSVQSSPASKTFQISAKSLLEQCGCVSKLDNSVQILYPPLLCVMTVGSDSTKMLKIINFLIKQIEIKPFFHRNLSVSLILGFNSKFN